MPIPPPSKSPEAHFSRDGEWLVVRAHGECDLVWLKALIPQVLEQHERAPARAVLIDARDLTASFSDLDRFEMGVAVAQARALPPLAMVGHTDFVDPRRLGELAARNRGANIRVFTDIAAAREWLTVATA